MPNRAITITLALLCCLPAVVGGNTTIRYDDLDPAAFAQWVDGSEQAIAPADSKDNDRKPQWVLWTDKSQPGHAGFAFGKSNNPGPRHLRVGLKTAARAGAVLVRGGAQVSVLKPDVPYPGDMANEAHWLPAERIIGRKVGRDEMARDNYVLWTLPQVVQTRAIRFTHVAEVTDREYAGWVGGASVLAARVANVAPQATAVGSASQKSAPKLNNQHVDPTWEQWGNIDHDGGDRPTPVSAESPEWAMLVWNAPVQLSGVGVVFAGFAGADVQQYTGPADVHPREAKEEAWKTVARFDGLRNLYPISLPVSWLPFEQPVTTRALRLRITTPLNDGGHPHVQKHPRGGKRVWVGELLALHPLVDSAPLQTAVLPEAAATEKPPIAVKFTLPEPGWVTLVIEDATGKRMRNLVSDTFFGKGENTVWWDGSDDLGRDPSAAGHGLYYIPTQLVAPGRYTVRGLWRKQVDVKYEFGVYSAGTTPWETADRSGGWLSNHTPPSSVLFVPDVPRENGTTTPSILIGSYVSEGNAGLAWVDLDGRKYRGQNWVGGNWTGAPYLARDAGKKAAPGNYAYVAAAWEAGPSDKKATEKKGEIRLTGLTAKEDRSILKHTFTAPADAEGKVKWEDHIGGLAVHDGVAVVSMTALNKLLIIDVAAGKVTGEREIASPRGLAFDAQGRLLVASGNQVLRIAASDLAKAPPEPVITALEAAHGLTVDSAGNLYVADRGGSHQVKVFSPDAKPLRAIGKPGKPQAGPYDPLHMNNPRGVTVDPQGRLWVAEEDYQPKRISIWNPDGSLVRAFYGPSEYGGGGSIDPLDKSRFYYDGMEFALDWKAGTDQLRSIFYRHDTVRLELPFRAGVPQNAIHHAGRRYWTNCYNSSPTGGHGSAFIFADRDGIAVPVAGAGRANDWDVLKGEAFRAVWPAGTDSKSNPHSDKAAFFLWADANADGQVQPNEVQLKRTTTGGVTVMRDLSFVVARLDGKAVRFAPGPIPENGIPTYDLAAPQVLIDAANSPPSSGGDQAMVLPDGWTIHTNAPKPFSGHGIGGAKAGTQLWSYPSLWPGLHASHTAPVPDRPGMVIGHTRLIGDYISPPGAEPMWLINSNHGPVYVFTADGLFVAQLMQDMRVGRPWRMPVAQRGMLLTEITPSDENFWPNVTQTADGQVYLVAGRPNCIVRVEGLETVRRLPASPLEVTPQDLANAREFYARAEAARQAAQGRGALVVTLRKSAPTVDGKLDDWATAEWADIDKRGTRAYFNSPADAYDVTGAVAIAGDRLYAAWRTGDKDLLRNSGEVPNALFKTGGALDLMIAADPAADPKRPKPAPGDQRLLITRVNGKPKALLYRAVVPGSPSPVPFSSPWNTVTFDRVDDVTDQIQLAAGPDGDYEASIPLALLALAPKPGQTTRGDIGILRGTGTTTTQRIYWSNKATAIVADVPSEAELRPGLWGRFEYRE